MASFKVKKEDGSWENIGSRQVVVDETLTQTGWAADAKAVGDAIENHTHTPQEAGIQISESVIEGSESLVTSGAVHTAQNNLSMDDYVEVTGGEMEGALIADSVSAADLTMAQVRNIYAGTVDMEDGVSELTAGALYLVFEEGV